MSSYTYVIKIIDGDLHRVVWCKDDTFSVVLNKYVKYVQTHCGSSIVASDSYSDYCKIITALEPPKVAAPM